MALRWLFRDGCKLGYEGNDLKFRVVPEPTHWNSIGTCSLFVEGHPLVVFRGDRESCVREAEYRHKQTQGATA